MHVYVPCIISLPRFYTSFTDYDYLFGQSESGDARWTRDRVVPRPKVYLYYKLIRTLCVPMRFIGIDQNCTNSIAITSTIDIPDWWRRIGRHSPFHSNTCSSSRSSSIRNSIGVAIVHVSEGDGDEYSFGPEQHHIKFICVLPSCQDLIHYL